VVVASLATLAVVRTLLLPAPDSSSKSQITQVDPDTAGRIESDWIDDPVTAHPAPPPILISLTVDRSLPTQEYLEEAGLDRQAAASWAAALARSAEVRRFDRGHVLTLMRDPETGELRGLRYTLDERVAVSQQTYGEGVLRTVEEPIRYVLRPVAISFQLRHGFWRDARGQAIPRPILDTLDYAFHDYHPLTSLPRGAAVKLIYQEKVSHDGAASFATGLEAAAISFQGKTLTAFAFPDENGRPRLYNSDGVALGAEALRFPLNFDYISSGFSYHRFHPILHQYRAHTGVDLAARYGTPVHAVADGRVEQAGWCGELGKCVRIQHSGGVVTVYGHLSRVMTAPGEDVSVGELIGLVGATGLATGPHLHYAIEKDGQYVNPLTETLGVHHQVSPRLRGLFESFRREYLAVLERLPLGGRYAVALPAAEAPGNAVLTTAYTPTRGSRAARLTTASESFARAPAALLPVSGRSSVLR